MGRTLYLGDLVDVVPRVVVIAQSQVTLTLFLVVEVCMAVALIFDKLLVAVDISVKMAEPAM